MKDIQKHLMKILYTGHRHDDMSTWLACKTCGEKYQLWKKERDRLKDAHPKEFERYKKKWTPGPELLEKMERMKYEIERRKNPGLFRTT